MKPQKETGWRQTLIDKLVESQQVKRSSLANTMSMASLRNVGRKLFHYTTAKGLEGIVANGCLWATAAAYLNDASEIEYGCSVLEEVSDKWKHTNPKPSQLVGQVVDLLQDIFNDPRAKLERSTTTYVACFCADDNLLSQWRAYGQVGGYSIGFSLLPQGLKGIGTTKLTGLKPQSNGYRAILEPVQYDESTQFAVLEEVLNRCLLALEQPDITEIASRLEPSEYKKLVGMTVLIMRDMLMNQIVAFKNKAFEVEREWRIVVRPAFGTKTWMDGTKDEAVYVRSDRGLIIPYVKLVPTDGTLPIRSVTIGPTLDKTRAEPSVRLLLTQKGHSSFDVNGSDIPVVM